MHSPILMFQSSHFAAIPGEEYEIPVLVRQLDTMFRLERVDLLRR